MIAENPQYKYTTILNKLINNIIRNIHKYFENDVQVGNRLER